MELFHFTRQHSYSSPSLDLTPMGRHILQPKPIWRYLGFFFDRKLSFHYHCHYYATKSISTIRGMKLLGSSMRGLNPIHKHLLYQTCVLPIALYGFQLWYTKNSPKKYHIYKLNKLQRRAALWITGAFKTSPTKGIEGIAGLILIHLHLRKLAGRVQLKYSSIPSNHAISSLLKFGHSPPLKTHKLNMGLLTTKQINKLKSPIADADQRLNQIHHAFVPIIPGLRIIDFFPF